MSSSATEINNKISSSELKVAMQELYSNYTGISFNMDETNNPKMLTLEQYNEILKETKNNLDQREQQIEMDSINKEYTPEIIKMSIMPYTYACNVNTIVYGSNKAFQQCRFTISIVATADAQYNKYISLDSHSVYKNGISLNVLSCSITNQYGSISSDSTKAYVGANVSITFEYSIGGFKYQETVNQLVAQSFNL